MVDVVGELGVEVAQRIVGKGRQVDDGVESVDVSDLDVADVSFDYGHVSERAAERAVPIEVGVQSDHLDAGSLEEGHHDRADETFVTSDENPHDLSFPRAQNVAIPWVSFPWTVRPMCAFIKTQLGTAARPTLRHHAAVSST